MTQSTKNQAPKSFSAATKNVTAGEVAEMTKAIDAAFAKRKAFETAKGKGPEHGIHAKLEAARKDLTTENAVRVLIAAGVDADFVNHTTNEGNGFNIYAIDKLADLVATLDSGIFKNKVNNAVTRSLFAFKKAGESFTGELAKASASDKIRIQGQIAKLLVRHTVSAATAPTQMSSTMSALQVLGVVQNTGGRREPVYEATQTLAAKRMEEIVAKAA